MAHCEIELELLRSLSLVGLLYREQKLQAVHVEELGAFFSDFSLVGQNWVEDLHEIVYEQMCDNRI